MIHPHTERKYINGEVGHGVVATEFIPAGTITWVRDLLDREFTPAELAALPPLYREIVETYTFRNRIGNFVFCWDHGRYVNHSFRPNCLATAYGFEVAIRDILPGEELTNDYGMLNIIAPFEPADEGSERKWVYPDDLRRFYALWDAQVGAVFHQIVQLQQPLQPYVVPASWAEVLEVAAGNRPKRSVLENLYVASGD